MAASKKKEKKVKQGGEPQGRSFGNNNPDSSLSEHISWSFASCDMDPAIRWSFCRERLAESFWELLLPKMREFESMTLDDIFVKAKKQNHGIDVSKLSTAAARRLEELHIEAESVHSLRLGGRLRLYGVRGGSVYSIIWYDDDHGDNPNCVCRSSKKGT